MLYLTEADVTALLSPVEAIGAVAGSFARAARGGVDNRPRERMPLADGVFAVMACVDRELGYAGLKSYAWTETGTPFVVCLFSLSPTLLAAVIEADRLGQLRTGAASAIAARTLARPGATTLGVIGAGWQAASQVSCIRAALPSIEHVVVYSRDPQRLAAFCAENGCEAAGSPMDAAAADVVVTVTTSKAPVLRGDWIRPGTLVCAVGANDASRRELDDRVLERASLICCDSVGQTQIESGDLIDPVARGLLDWPQVLELADVIGGAVQGRASDDEIVVFKSNGIAAWDVALGARLIELAEAQGVGVRL